AQVNDRKAYVLVVCDGVSSSQAADLASQTAAEATCNALTEALYSHDGMTETAMHAAVDAALLAVRALPYTNSEDRDPPSTTLVGGVVCEGGATIGGVGDSRAYWVNGERVQQLTHDHSWLNEVVVAGDMSLEEARRSPQAHALTRWLGADADAHTAAATVVQVALSGAGLVFPVAEGHGNCCARRGQVSALGPGAAGQ